MNLPRQPSKPQLDPVDPGPVDPSPSAPIRLLFVCLGNICRSPAAEGVFLHQIAAENLQHRFVVDSAGIGAWHVGQPADPRMRAAAQRRGIHLPSRARQLEPADLQAFDRILTMDAENLAAVRRLQRQHGGSAVVEPMMRYGRRFAVEHVPDPYYGGAEGFEHVLDLLDDACAGLLQSLSGGPKPA
ncbi:MAG: low molecular weight protein-tyrosine-phosphatase [Synechococcaceae cyanobacterium]|nr:low molecular weight protein-tyrosine-phosphatase [Synechococcaceae cyanobacterium]